MSHFFTSGWPKYWSFNFNISPSSEHPGLIAFRMDCQESSPASQFKSINSSVLSFPYDLTLTSVHNYWKSIAWTRRIFVNKVMSLLFNKLPRLVTAFFPRSKHLLIPWLQSPSIVILETKKMKPLTVSIVSPSICHEVIGLGCPDLRFLNVEF